MPKHLVKAAVPIVLPRRKFLKAAAGGLLFAPSIVRAGCLPLLGAGGSCGAATPSGSGWGDHGTLISLSTTTITNDTATTAQSGTFTTVRGTKSNGAGKWYFELKVLTAGSGFCIPGLMDATTPNGAAMDSFLLPNSIANYSANGTSKNIGAGFSGVDIGSGWSLANNDVMAIAWDGTNGFSYLAKNNVWFLSGDPTSGASGTGHVGAYASPPISLYPAISLDIDGVYQLKTASFTFTPPSGYSAWN